MKRLTRKSLEYKDTWIADGSLSNIEGVVRGKAIDRLAKLEDVLEKWHIENLEGYISALIEVRNIAIEEKKTQFKRYIEEVTKREKLEQELADLQHRLKVAEIATKLACERVKNFEEMQDREMGFEDFFGYESNYDLQSIIEQYKEQAEKEVKGE